MEYLEQHSGLKVDISKFKVHEFFSYRKQLNDA